MIDLNEFKDKIKQHISECLNYYRNIKNIVWIKILISKE